LHDTGDDGITRKPVIRTRFVDPGAEPGGAAGEEEAVVVVARPATVPGTVDVGAVDRGTVDGRVLVAVEAGDERVVVVDDDAWCPPPQLARSAVATAAPAAAIERGATRRMNGGYDGNLSYPVRRCPASSTPRRPM
jgi:hypothetical protein